MNDRKASPAAMAAGDIATPTRRLVSLDLARSIAIASVISMHINEATLTGLARSAAVSFGSLGVPIFAALTGYLMLDRDYRSAAGIKRFVKSSLLPMLVALEVWNGLWSVLGAVTGSPIPVEQTVKVALFLGDFSGGFWYVPMIFGVYLGLPLLANLLSYLSDPARRTYALIVAAAIAYFAIVIPTVTEVSAILGHPVGIRASLEFGVFGPNDELGRSLWPLYLAAGYRLKRARPHGVRWVLPAIAVCCASFALLCMMRSRAFDAGVGFNPSNYANGLVAVCSISLLTFLVSLEDLLAKLPRVLTGFVAIISRCSFGIYMIHFTVLGQILSHLPWALDKGCVSFLALEASVLALSAIPIAILSLIPGINRYVLLVKPFSSGALASQRAYLSPESPEKAKTGRHFASLTERS